MDRANGSTDILDMAFISPKLAKHDIQFQIGDDLDSDHPSIEISTNTPPHRSSSTNHIKYKFDQSDREVFESTLEEALGSANFSGHLSTSDLDKYADFIVTAVNTAVVKPFRNLKACHLRVIQFPMLIKVKCRLRRQCSQKKDLAIKTLINQLQKQVKEELKHKPWSAEGLENQIH